MWFIWAIASALVFGLASFFMKVNSFWSLPTMSFLTGLYASGTAGFLLVAILEHSLEINVWILIAGVVIGLGSTYGNLLFMRALEYGPASLTSPLVNTNILLIVLFGVLLYGEQLSVWQYSGIALVCVAIFTLPFDPNEGISIKGNVWYALVFLATALMFLRNGGLKATEEASLANTPILMVAYAFGLLVSIILVRQSKEKSSAGKGKGFAWGLVAGLFSFGGMQLYAIALRDGPVSIVSPLFAAHALFVAVLSMLYLKERISKYQAASLVLVVIGIVLLRGEG
ncbi:DMT family transporter [Shouchella shacheensis]|uniref:DMT family transporter n=1 Tax=Shouchella shacheensis TaxID=1649580 RepID=UPI00074004B2|nr:EamA family transporter [Shouchella shacheensis]